MSGATTNPVSLPQADEVVCSSGTSTLGLQTGSKRYRAATKWQGVQLLVLCFYLEVTGCLNPPVLTGVSTNNGNTGDSFLGNTLTSVSSTFFTTSGNLSLAVYGLKNPAATRAVVNLYQVVDGQFVHQVPCSLVAAVGGLAMKDPLKVLVADAASFGYESGTLRNSSGVYAWTLDHSSTANSPSDIGSVSAAVGIVSSNIVVLWGSTGYKYAWRYDISLDSKSHSGASLLNSNYSFVLQTAWSLTQYNTDFVVPSMSNTVSIPVIKYSDFSVQYVLNRTAGCSAYASVFDNLAPNRLYEIWDRSSAATSVPVLVSINMANYTALDKIFPDLSLPDLVYSNILNFGPYQYLGVITGQGATVDSIRLVYKSNLTLLAWSGAALTVQMYSHSLLGVVENDLLHYFSFVDVNSNGDSNFQSYYLELDRCDTRDTTDPTLCLQCIAPFYRNNLNPSNICLHYPYYPIGEGPDIANNVLVSCQQSSCLNCMYDHLECTFCDIAIPTYLQFRGDKQCYTSAQISTFTGYWGTKVSNGNNGTCAQCSFGCIDCTSDHDFCVSCNTPTFFLDQSNGVCYNDMNAPVGIGRNTITNKAVGCSVTNCSNCSAVYTACISCRVNQNAFFNTSTSLCVYYLNIPNGFGGNRLTSQIQACSMVGCQTCKYDYSVCTICDTAAGYFMNSSTGICTFYSSIIPGFGGSLATKDIQPCTVSGCTNCQSDNTVCQACDMSQQLFLNQTAQICILKGNIPTRKGPNLATSILLGCADSNCLDCQNDFTLCKFCDVSINYMLTSAGCISAELAQSGTGLNRTNSKNEVCAAKGCLDCKLDISICKSCDETNGYFLEGVNCIYTTANLAIQTNPKKSQLVDASFLISATLTDQSVSLSQVLQAVKRYFQFQHKYYSASTGLEVKLSDSLRISFAQKWLVLDLNFIDYPQSSTYSLEWSSNLYSVIPSQSNQEFNFTIVGFPTFKVELSDIASLPEVENAKNQGSLVSGFVNVGDSGSTSTYTQTALVGASSLDPTGTLVKFNQILKIINKLYFININYGSRLDAFMKGIGAGSSKPTRQQRDLFVRSVKGSFGKLSRNYITLDLFEALSWQIPVYLGIKIFSCVCSLILRGFKISKLPIRIIYYSKKADMVVSNLFLADIIWYCSHTLSHGRNLSILMNSVCLISLGLVSWDIFRILEISYSQSIWSRKCWKLWKLQTLAAGQRTANQIPPNPIQSPTSQKGQEVDTKSVTPQAQPSQQKIEHRNHLLTENSHQDLSVVERDQISSSRKIHPEGPISLNFLAAATKQQSANGKVKKKVVPAAFSSSMRLITTKSNNKQNLESLESAKGGDSKQQRIGAKQSPGSVRVIYHKPPVLDFVNPSKLLNPLPIRFVQTQDEITVQEKSTKINYRETAAYLLDADPHIVTVVTAPLRKHPLAFQSALSRLHYSFYMSRIGIYELGVLSCQYSVNLGIIILLSCEIAKLSLVVYCYVKYKYLKNIICLLMEVSQSIFLTLFLVIALLISPKRFDEPVIDFYQDAGIWIVIASCVAEYLLLITYITVAAYEFIKNRKIKKNGTAESEENFIKYGEDEYENAEAEGVMIHTGEELLRLRFNWKKRFEVSKLIQVANFASVKPKTSHALVVNTATKLIMPTEKLPAKNEHPDPSLPISQLALKPYSSFRIMSPQKQPLHVIKKKKSDESIQPFQEIAKGEEPVPKVGSHNEFNSVYQKAASHSSLLSLTKTTRVKKIRGIQQESESK